MMSRLRMAVVGVGHLGKEHARILAGMPEVELVGVVDMNLDQAETVARRCATRAFRDYRQLPMPLDAAVLAVPTTHHHAVGLDLLRWGAALLIEKPLAATLAEAQALTDAGRECGVVVQVGHIERFNPAFEELQARPLRPKFLSFERVGPFSGRSTDVGVVLDVMVHDLDLVLALVGSPVREVRAVGVSVLGGHEDVAHAQLEFENGAVATVSASRVSPTASRRMQAWGPEGFASVDFARRQLTLVQPSEGLRRHGLDLRRLTPGQAASLKEEMFGRHLEVLELDRNVGDQLTRELQHFIDCVRYRRRPRVCAEAGRDAVALAERVLLSLRGHAWEGHANGPTGPMQLPVAAGTLFEPFEVRAAA